MHTSSSHPPGRDRAGEMRDADPDRGSDLEFLSVPKKRVPSRPEKNEPKDCGKMSCLTVKETVELEK